MQPLRRKLKSKIISSHLKDFFPRIRLVKVRRQKSRWRTVEQTAKKWHVQAFVTSWYHIEIMQGHVSDSKCSWAAGIISYATCLLKYTCYTRSNSRPFCSLEFLTLGTMTQHRPRCHYPRYFCHFRSLVWQCSCSNFDLGPSPSKSTIKAPNIRDYGLECSITFNVIFFSVWWLHGVHESPSSAVRGKRSTSLCTRWLCTRTSSDLLGKGPSQCLKCKPGKSKCST